ncbi:hypothetical protein V2I01_15865 [Micromonospora sp. BRA006-A]|nr:hypothetical protein [Micromonospora sp. BRA006-A]
MTAHVFVDETKERGLLVAAVVMHPADLTAARRSIRDLILPGQHRIHFHKERDDRRRQIIDGFRALRARRHLRREGTSQRPGRSRGLPRRSGGAYGEDRGCPPRPERDDSTFQADQRLLFEQVRKCGWMERCGTTSYALTRMSAGRSRRVGLVLGQRRALDGLHPPHDQ